MISLAMETLNKDTDKRNEAIKKFLDTVLNYYENVVEEKLHEWKLKQ